MRLVIGGVYQGKLAYVKEHYGIADPEVFDCTPDKEPDRKAKCLDHYENYILYCMRNGMPIEPVEESDKIFIFTDIFCGVVPMDHEQRAWREACGRAMTALAKQAESVERIFCGLSCKLK